MESPFPSPLERTVVSSLLLLSTTNPRSLTPPLLDTDGELLLKSKSDSSSEEKSLESSGGSKRCASSSLTSDDDGSSIEIRARKLRVMAVVSRCHEMNLQVIRKRRSSIRQKVESLKPAPSSKAVWSESVSMDDGSCLSSSASVDSSARSQCVRRDGGRDEPRRKKVRGSGGCYNHIERRAEAILKLLSSGGGSSEVKIRLVLGDSPDTSKALRMLLKQEEVKRSGTGGRQDPYIYTIAE